MKFHKSLRIFEGKRGQFIIIASLLIGVLVLGLVIGVNEIGLQRQELRYKPLKELIFSVTGDANRALTTALRKGTEAYNISFWDDSFPQNHEIASAEASTIIENFISVWSRSVVTSYSTEGIQLKIPFGDKDLFKKSIDWTGNPGVSSAEMYLRLNFTAEGFSGWEGALMSYFMLYVPIYAPENVTLKTFKFWLCRWFG
ncbi:MAG: hypothetical protein QXU67_06155, partial [Candidatus Bathyarchaeia archaeon]